MPLDIEQIRDMLPSFYGTGWEIKNATECVQVDGTTTISKQAFLVIKKVKPVESSKPMEVFKPAWPPEDLQLQQNDNTQ